MSKKKDKHIAYDDPNSWTYNYAVKQEKMMTKERKQ